jgi:uroporphyrinogen-III synthase
MIGEPVFVVRPEPAQSQTIATLKAAGIDARGIALFQVGALPWQPPSLARIDALLVTSANAMRHGGVALAALRHLPVVAVGEASANAARVVGFDVAITGTSDAAAARDAAKDAGYRHLLHLAGRDHVALPGVEAITLYASDTVDLAPEETAAFEGATVLLHSPRAARHLSALIDRDARDRGRIAIGAFSPAVAEAAGDGWRRVAIAAAPTDDALIAALERG